MRVIIILAAIALTHGAKLERTYLPPSNAGTAGGSGNFLKTPLSGVSGPSIAATRNTYQTAQPGFAQSGNGFSQSSNGIGQSQNVYSQSGNDYAQSSNGFAQSGNGFAQSGAQYDNVNFNNFAAEARAERPRAALDRSAAILRQDSSNDGETFSYAYETENGIYAEESGVATNGVEAQGGYSYTGDDGQVYSVRYTADQNGFVPQGDHLPTPPPVPEEILKALEQNARDEAAGIYDDGSYNEGKYAPAANNNRQLNYQPNNAFNGNDDDTVVTNSAFARSGNAPSYNAARNGPSYNTPNNIAPTYGAPNAGNAPSFTTGTAGVAPNYVAPNAGNAPSFNAPAGNNPFNSANAGINGFNAPNAAISRSSGAEKAYLPPLADQRGQERNAFGRRQQSFDTRTGYKY